MNTVMVMAFSSIAPVSDINAPIRSGDQVHPTKPGIFHKAHVRTAFGRVASSFPYRNVTVDSQTVQVQCVDPVAILFRPVVSLIDHQSDVSMSAPGSTGLVRHTFANISPRFTRVPVNVVRRLLDQLIRMRVHVDAIHASHMSPRNHMP